MQTKLTKSFLSIALCAALLLSVAAAAAPAPTFTDVPATNWAFGSIENAAANGMVTGIGNGLFQPDGSVTTSQFITILTRACYAAELESTTSAMDKWWGVNMQVAQNHGLLAGTQADSTYSNNTWSVSAVEAEMTRYDAAQIISNFMKSGYAQYMATSEELQAVVSQIGDYATIPQNYREAVCNMYVLGILNGVDSAGRYGGAASLTRAQACIIFERLFVTIEKSDYLSNCVYEPVTVTRMTFDSSTETPSTSTYQAGHLANGKPITEENIQEMLEEFKLLYPEGTEWSDDPKYDDRNSTLFGWAGGCNSFASMLSDYLFGKDAPVNIHSNYDQIKVGDVIYLKNSANGYSHVVVVTEIVGNYYRHCSGNVNGEVSWIGLNDASNLQLSSNSATRVYSRYSTSDVTTSTGSPAGTTTDNNTATGTYQAGYLANGKPITEENIQEMLEEFKVMYPQDTPWDSSPEYIQDTTLFGTAGECASFASMLSDYIFGKDAPVNVHTNYDAIKVGDVIWIKNSENGYSHAVVVTEIIGDRYRCCSGNMSGKVSWNGLNYISDLQASSFSATRVYSRY